MTNHQGKFRGPCPIDVLLVDGGGILLHLLAELGPCTSRSSASQCRGYRHPWTSSELLVRHRQATAPDGCSRSCSSCSPGSDTFTQYPVAVVMAVVV